MQVITYIEASYLEHKFQESTLRHVKFLNPTIFCVLCRFIYDEIVVLVPKLFQTLLKQNVPFLMGYFVILNFYKYSSSRNVSNVNVKNKRKSELQ